MDLESAIKHCQEVAEKQEKAAKEWHENQVRKCELIPFAEMDYTHENECKKCAEKHRQLAEWLKELKQLREQKESIINDNDRYYIVKQGCPNCGYGTIFIDKKMIKSIVYTDNDY